MANRSLQQERWLPVVEFEGSYEVSDQGRIRSLPRSHTPGGIRPSWNLGRGYRRIVLFRDGKRIGRLVHQLVLEAFVGPCPPNHECRHLNGAHGDNRLENLAWGTRSENANDRVRHGTHVDNRGELDGNAILTEPAVRTIRYFQGRKGRTLLARLHRVSPTTIHDVWTRKSWRHVP